jgi:uncharacterized protein
MTDKHFDFDPIPVLSDELNLNPERISTVIKFLSDGNTVPFIARYRKEATGELDEVQIRLIDERHAYLKDLEDRRRTILSSIEEQGKLSAELREKILAADTKSAVEDLYLPYRPKRRTRATAARERGLVPLAERILAQPKEANPQKEALAFVNQEKGVLDQKDALAGARDIVAEIIAEQAEVRAFVREAFYKQGKLSVTVAATKKENTKYEQYYDHQEAVATIPSHRFLAIRRGEREGVLKACIQVDVDPLLTRILSRNGWEKSSPFSAELRSAVEDGYTRLIATGVENDVRVELKQRSDEAAVNVFAANMRNLLMAAPLGEKPVLGIDPGLRTGCKIAAVDATGKFLENTTLFLSRSAEEKEKAKRTVLLWLDRYKPTAMAVGNGTGGRETEAFLRKLLDTTGGQAKPKVVQVNEAGASVYSASDIARQEFPDQDLTVRGAISIARRLQDPLAELVKIEPKAIGVGQYQHDVFQPLLARKLDEVIESCVNQVGVELNTTSAPLLARVAGIGQKMAQRIVDYRNQNGPFAERKTLLKVSGLGPRTFEQAAGFIRIRDGKNPLDSSAVHPERYPLVERISTDMQVSSSELIGNLKLISRIEMQKYISPEVGEPTLKDILEELRKPGRDPRSSFDPVRFKEGVNAIGDLEEGMALEGIVTNVTNFGAFVDVGVHRDGLVHISQLSDTYVDDPHKVIKVGDRIKVRVLEVDVQRDRISLTARTEQPKKGKDTQSSTQKPTRKNTARAANRRRNNKVQESKPETSTSLTHNPFANLLKKS